MPDTRPIGTVQDVAKLLKISAVSVRSLVKKGKLEGFRLDSRFRLFLDSLPIFKKNMNRKEDTRNE